jgi:hypothetical protein
MSAYGPPFYKAVRPDGTDFRTGTVDYLTGDVVTCPGGRQGEYHASYYLSMSTEPADCTGMRWPCRLLLVEPVGPTWQPDLEGMPNKVACLSLRVMEELPAHMALGPQGEKVAALIDRAGRLTDAEVRGLDAARNAARGAAWDAAWDAARDAAWCAAWDAAWDAAWCAARDAARALVAADLFSEEDFQRLAGPWISIIGDPR